MMVAMVVEAALCLPKLVRPAAAPTGGSPRMNATRSLTFNATPWSIYALSPSLCW